MFGFCTWTQQTADRGEAFIPTNVRMDAHNVFGPDVSWLGESELPSQDDCLYIEGPLRSRSRFARRPRAYIGTKKANYERRGCRELWLVDGDADIVLVFRRSARGAGTFDVALELGRGEELGSPQLPGFSLALEALFAPLRPQAPSTAPPS